MESTVYLRHPLSPTREEYIRGNAIFTEFKAKPGSDQIANPGAIWFLIHILGKLQPKVILECGTGIGTLTKTVAGEVPKDSRIVAIEDNDFCLTQLQMNLKDEQGRFEVITNEEDLASLGLKTDLIIADGGWMSQAEYDTVQQGTVVFAEGHRGEFRRRLDKHLSSQGLKIDMHNYCSESELKVFFRRFLGIPIPWKIYRKCTQKGCWIGQVTQGVSDGKRPATYQIDFPAG